MKRSILLLLSVALASSSCDRKKPSAANDSTESSAVAAARTDEDMLRTEVARGLNDQFNIISIPIGDVEIMSPLSSQMENHDINSKRFKDDYYTGYLEQLETQGLV
jgi:hypothetical protein